MKLFAKIIFLSLLVIAPVVAWAQASDVMDYKKLLSTTTEELSKEASQPTGKEVDLLLKQADLMLINGDYEQALQKNMKVYKTVRAQSKSDKIQLEQVQYQIFQCFLAMGNFSIADKILQKDIEIVEKKFSKTDVQYIRMYTSVGRIATLLSDYKRADDYFSKADELIKKAPETTAEIKAENLIRRAYYYSKIGQYTASEALFKNGITIIKQQLPKGHVLMTETNIAYAELYKNLHNYNKAYSLLTTSEEFYKNLKSDHPVLAGIYNQKAFLYLAVDNTLKAKSFIDQSEAIVPPVFYKNNYFYDRKIALAEYNSRIKNFDAADNIYTEISDSIATYAGDRSIYYANLLRSHAGHYYNMGKYEEAIGTYQLVIDIQKDLLDNAHPDYIEVINQLSLISWAMERNGMARSNFKKSADNYIKEFNRYFAFLSEKEKSLLYKNIKLFFDRYNMFVLQNTINKTGSSELLAEMYNNQLISKGILFHSSQELKKNIFANGDPVLIAKFNQWVIYKEQIAKLYKIDAQDIIDRNIPLDSIESALNALEKEINLRTVLTKNSKDDVQSEENVATWQTVRNALAANEAAVEIIRVPEFLPDSGGHFTGKVYYVSLTIKKDSKYPEIQYLEEGKDLESRSIKYYRNGIHYNITDTVSYAHFWSQIMSDKVLDKCSKVFISLDGVYTQLNLNTLFDQATNQYVSDKYNLHFVTNTKDILEFKKSASLSLNSENVRPVFFGFPNYNYRNKETVTVSATANTTGAPVSRALHTRGNFRAAFRGGVIHELPGTKTEVESIEKLFKQNNKTVTKYMSYEALEEDLKKVQSPSILHIATHGFFVPLEPAALKADEIGDEEVDNPLLRSGLLLTGASYAYSDEVVTEQTDAIMKGQNKEDGIITAFEAMNLNLSNTELVVLSACETGLGEVKNGEGVYGLQRSLMTSGVKTVIMSMWKVDDDATQKLMLYFYEEWFKTSDKRASFEKAQKRLRLEYKDPIYWGAFIMIGE
jgi:CHAT domain-containing protein